MRFIIASRPHTHSSIQIFILNFMNQKMILADFVEKEDNDTSTQLEIFKGNKYTLEGGGGGGQE